jgi:putative N6-adenine-specific DNA methylase
VKLIIKTYAGLEKVLAEELRALGAENIVILKRAAACNGGKKLIYAINYRSRLALRVLVDITSFSAKNENELYSNVKKVQWEDYISLEDTFAVESTVNSQQFRHSKYAALKVKDAVADRFRERTGKRPSVDVTNPDLLIHIHIAGTQCALSVDSSGGGLHRRGYRSRQLEAPLNEVLAAGLILLSGWQGSTPFIDPMCGSGTIAIEAALIALNIPPGSFSRQFGFMSWKDFDASLWNKVKEEAQKEIKQKAPEITASDISGKAVSTARSNMKHAGVKQHINLLNKSFDALDKPAGEGTIIMNPPYGERLKKSEIELFYKQIGDTLKSTFAGFDAWIFSGNIEAMKKVGLRTSKKITLYNGSILCKYHKYELYRGSKKE